MKKLILIVALMAGVSFSSKAQHFYASFGVQQSWGVPVHVSNMIYDSYCGYDWVHASRVTRHGRLFFDVVLQRGNTFIELRVGRHGHVHRTRYYDYYPFASHACSNVCGFHGTFYRNSYRVYNNYYHGPGQRHGHHRRGNKTVVINNHYHNNSKHNNHGHHYNNNHRNRNNRVNHRQVSNNRYPERKGTYYSSGNKKGRENQGRRPSYNQGGRSNSNRDGRLSNSGRGRGSRRSY